MKGIVFTEFLEMVEDKFGWEMSDHIVESSDLKSGGVYTAVGTYDHEEIVQMVGHLSAKTDIPVPDLLQVYGEHLFSRLHTGHSNFFEGIDSVFNFVKTIENHIHVEVRKLYPDAELPTIGFTQIDDDTVKINYSSERPLADFAKGMLIGCINHFGEDINISREDAANSDGKNATFTLSRRSQ